MNFKILYTYFFFQIFDPLFGYLLTEVRLLQAKLRWRYFRLSSEMYVMQNVDAYISRI